MVIKILDLFFFGNLVLHYFLISKEQYNGIKIPLYQK